MSDINDLRQARAEQLEKVQALAALEAKGTELSAEQLEEFVTAQTEFERIGAQITRAETAERMAAAASTPVPGLGGNNGSSIGSISVVGQPAIKGGRVARMVQAIGATQGGTQSPAHYAEHTLKDSEVAAALNTGTGSAGGVLIPQVFLGELIELLQPQSVVRSFDPTILPMPNGNTSIPKLVGGAMSSYTDENDDIEASEQQFGDLKLSAKTLATLVPVSNQLLNYNGLNGNLEKVIVGDMVNSMGLREDHAFIRGDGANNTPKGFRHAAPAANILVASDGSTVQKVKNDLGKMELALLNANVRMLRPGWVLNPTTFVFLSNLVDGNGNSVFPEMANKMLRGKPFKTTTQVPSNLGGGNESEIYLVDFIDAVIGDSEDVTIAVSTEATYKDPNTGDLISAFTRNQTLIRVISAHDFGMRHDASVCVMTGVTWGAV